MLWTYVINDLNEEEIADFFLRKRIAKTKESLNWKPNQERRW